MYCRNKTFAFKETGRWSILATALAALNDEPEDLETRKIKWCVVNVLDAQSLCHCYFRDLFNQIQDPRKYEFALDNHVTHSYVACSSCFVGGSRKF